MATFIVFTSRIPSHNAYMVRTRVHPFTHISWWRHQMEMCSALLALCEGNPPVTGGFPSQRPVTRIFYVFFDLRGRNGWANNRDAADLSRHHAHYDVTVMMHMCVSILGQHCLSSVPIPHLSHWWLIAKLDQIAVKFEPNLNNFQ